MCNFTLFRMMKKMKTNRKRWKNKSQKSKCRTLLMRALISKTENVIKQLLFIHQIAFHSLGLISCFAHMLQLVVNKFSEITGSKLLIQRCFESCSLSSER